MAFENKIPGVSGVPIRNHHLYNQPGGPVAPSAATNKSELGLLKSQGVNHCLTLLYGCVSHVKSRYFDTATRWTWSYLCDFIWIYTTSLREQYHNRTLLRV